jgi:hypothetical protein|tara:strand:- start:23 stop:211 length:189 start_codon:yes stop_codon:yes gene_type:complete
MAILYKKDRHDRAIARQAFLVREEKRKQGEALLPWVSDKALQKEVRRRGRQNDMQTSFKFGG